jgi:hypothetical protein
MSLSDPDQAKEIFPQEKKSQPKSKAGLQERGRGRAVPCMDLPKGYEAQVRRKVIGSRFERFESATKHILLPAIC